ncbi:MAG TPA: NAD(P)-dependent alcohol dehydrogenase [Tepidisphaeraceae bacterium]|nr:NAD(P)-dependent alcohol dehydrogenase [Tepidisphaeraceae bacterium]
MTKAHGYAAQTKTSSLAPFNFERRDVGPRDVQIEILFCGVCHSDIHQVRDEWGGSIYPMVPGHEIVGRVTKVGAQVKKFKPGDAAGVGCMVDSCRECESCRDGEEQYCDRGECVLTYNSRYKDGTPSYGGYSNQIVVDEAFALRISPKQNLAAVAPLLCAGITTYSPLKYWNVSKGQRVGVVGLGGLGHMALKLAHSFGAHVTQFTTSPGKEQDAIRLGADEVVLTRDPESLKKLAGSFHFIIDTVSALHDINLYLSLLRRNGNLTLVGAPDKPMAVGAFPLIMKRRSFSGSAIGGIRETQEMLDYCAEHNIVSDIELTPIQRINEAYERMLRNDVKYRFVIDMASLRE